MKEININGTIFKYRVVNENLTIFYFGVQTKIYPVWFSVLLFICKFKWINVYQDPKLVFTVSTSIENPLHSQECIKNLIDQGLDIMSRQNEIDKGEILPNTSNNMTKCIFCNKISMLSGIIQISNVGPLGSTMCYDPRTNPVTLCPENINRTLPGGTKLN